MTDPVPTRKQRQAETRQGLLAAAAVTFAAEGYHGASVSQIAARAGYTTGALYANFTSKEQLFLELVDQHLAHQRVELDHLLATDDPQAFTSAMRGRIEGLIHGMTRSAHLLAPPEDGQGLTVIQIQTLTMEFLLYAVRHRPELRQEIAERRRAIERQLLPVITRWLELQGAGHSDLSPQQLLLVQSWLTEGMALRLLQDPDLLPAEHAADLLETVMLRLAGIHQGPS